MEKLTSSMELNHLEVKTESVSMQDGLLEQKYCFVYKESAHCSLHSIPPYPLEDRPFVHLHFERSAENIAGVWRPNLGFKKSLMGDWSEVHQTNLSHFAPVVCFFDGQDRNCFTYALSEVGRDVVLLAGVHEENGDIHIDAIIYLDDIETKGSYDLSYRFDFRSLAFNQTLNGVSDWWDFILPDAPAKVPETANFPMYSTWYSYHQDMTDETLSKEYELASKLGMKAVIIDDGWQTADNNRGYGYCGDWNAEITKFPDFRAHVDKIHKFGMKCLLWYSVPFVGEFSGVWQIFKDKILHYDGLLHTGVLDPRYPSVRSYLISVYENAMDEWGLDGFKLDFIDMFRNYEDTPKYNEEMDFREIQDAVYCLMLDISRTLRAKNPELLLEFRQNYIGPQMRRFGNIFRVADCPLAPVTNRIGIADLKFISGNTAVHSDMLMWQKEESPERVAVHLINCIFSTLQISVKLNTLTEEQLSVLKHYLDFAVTYKDILQHGNFTVKGAQSLYPVLMADKRDMCIAACYESNYIIEVPTVSSSAEEIQKFWLLNGTAADRLYLAVTASSVYRIKVFDCTGKTVSEEVKECPSGITAVSVPVGGSAYLEKQ